MQVNEKMFDLKMELRRAGMPMHATDNVAEVLDNLRVLGS